MAAGPEMLVAERLAAIPEAEGVRLFGSRARGDARPRSDINLAIMEFRRTGRLLHAK
jgi:predicted nucleotidyltransferase